MVLITIAEICFGGCYLAVWKGVSMHSFLKALPAIMPIVQMVLGLLMTKPAEGKESKKYLASWIGFRVVAAGAVYGSQVLADRDSQPLASNRLRQHVRINTRSDQDRETGGEALGCAR